ncbi:MAG: sensor histidine kinase [Janthinobacterium lividum]
MKIAKVKLFFLVSILLIIKVQLIKAEKLSYLREENFSYSISYLEDKNGQMDLNQALQHTFKLLDSDEPNFGLTNSIFWFKIRLVNHTTNNSFLLKIHSGNVTSSEFYNLKSKFILKERLTDTTDYNKRKYNSQYPLFQINVQPDSVAICLLRVSSVDVMNLPISIDTNANVLNAINLDQLYFGIYSGIILIMFIYNIFIYFTVKDKTYLYYVLYIIIVGLAQACLKGYASKLLWPNSPWLIRNTPNFFIAFSGIFSILFVFNFLQIKKYVPYLFYILNIEILVYFIGIIINLSRNQILAQRVLQLNASFVALTILLCGTVTVRKKYRPAFFFNISWTFFLLGVLIYILKDRGMLPYNNFTNNSILIGSGLEVALLSFALADKINVFKAEKEASQAETLKAVQENARIIREQNVILETKVTERTVELQASNTDLHKALVDLKEAESQLVEAEKMASLGQLTAGIAHEINNPINFVTSNVAPLKRDIEMLMDTITTIEEIGLSEDSVEEKQNQIEEYKEEIDFDYLKLEIGHLLKGIHEGASRTAEIVKGLRVFSRLDEDDIKQADINEGLESTLVIANNLLSNKIQLIKQYGDIPFIECYPGKLNQVFLNIISNAIYAIKKRHEDKPGGILKIATHRDDHNVFIKIEDNGIGMDEITKKKIFEPFFTTKPVGEGTGLGMSITYNTIKKHNGQIYINSTPGIGTEFIIELQLHLETQLQME